MLAYILCLAVACHAWPSYGGLRDPGNCNPLAKDSRTYLCIVIIRVSIQY